MPRPTPTSTAPPGWLVPRTAWLVLLVALAGTAAVLLAPQPEQRQPRSTSGLSQDYQSVRAEALAAGLPSSQEQPAVLVYARTDGQALTPGDLGAVRASTAALAGVEGPAPDAQAAPSGRAAVAVLPLAADASTSRPPRPSPRCASGPASRCHRSCMCR